MTTYLLPAFSQNPETADSIYLNGDILTMNGDRPNYAEAVAVKDGKIVFVGEKSQVLKLKGNDTQIKDLQGKTLLPGFIDPHSHFVFALNMVNQVNVANPPVGPAKDIPSTIAAIQAYQEKTTFQKTDGLWVGVTTRKDCKKVVILPS